MPYTALNVDAAIALLRDHPFPTRERYGDTAAASDTSCQFAKPTGAPRMNLDAVTYRHRVLLMLARAREPLALATMTKSF